MGLTVVQTVFLVYFITHIPITIFIDSQAVLPVEKFPQFARDLGTFYQTQYNDKYMAAPEKFPWFQAMVYVELFLQFPFFIYATICFLRQKNSDLFRSLSIAYGAHVSTIVFVILFDMFKDPELSSADFQALLPLYLPYFAVPLLLMLYCILYPRPFAPSTAKKTQ